MKKLKRMLAWLGTFAVGLAAVADPTVTINSVRQNYPWNNTVEINYTIANVPTDAEWYASFNAVAGGTTYKLAPADIGVSKEAITDGTFDATWTAPDGISDNNASITVTLTEGGDDYMIVDLTTGEVTYEKMKSQSASNTKYNTNEYKTTKMVFRKITAPSGSVALANGSHTFSHDYYIGIFPLTQAQYRQVITSATCDNNARALGADVCTWMTLRGSSENFNTIPGVGHATDSTTSFLAVLNKKIKAKMGADYAKFDLPTEAAWEYASYGGEAVSRTWFFTDSTSEVDSTLTSYAWFNNDSTSDGTYTSGRRLVGIKQPNGYGMYDVYGNVWEFCRDRSAGTVRTDAFVATSSGHTTINRQMRGGGYNDGASYCSSVCRGYYNVSGYNSTDANYGFRLAWGCN